MYRLLHGILIYVFKFIFLFDKLVRALYGNLGNVFRRNRINGDSTFKVLHEVSDLLTKRPRHLAFLLNDGGDIDCLSLANAITWSVALKIPYITVYDRKGHVQHKREELFNKISFEVNALLGAVAKDLLLQISDISKPYENGVVYPKQICVQLLCDQDSRDDITQVCTSLSASTKTDIAESTANTIASRMKVMKNLPDPELLFQFGEVQSLMGFSPWHTHLSEIVHCKSHREFSCYALINGLLKFSNCEQRFGK